MAQAPDLFVVCRNCSSEVSGYVTECPYCGQRMRKRAPALDGTPLGRGSRKTGGARERGVARLTRLRAQEIPGLAGDPMGRPVVTIALVAVAAAGMTALGAVARIDVAIVGPLHGEWWRVATSPFFAFNGWYVVITLLALLVFGTSLERQYGHLAVLLIFILCAFGGAAAAAVLEPDPLALGANGAAIGMLAAWTIGPLLELRRRRETDADLIGAGVFAALLLALPVVVPEASPTAGAVGLLGGIVCGVVLARR